GHDEYWSEGMRDAFESFRDSGGHVLFMSGNEVFWRTRFSPDHTLMWVYKDTMDGPGAHVGGTPLDPVSWTGTWKDTRWVDRSPEHTITGTDFRMNGVNDIDAVIDHTAAFASHPFWRDTVVATGTSVTARGIIGFDADEIAPTQPAESTAVLAQHLVGINGARADDNGQSYDGNGDLNWGVVSQRYDSGAVVVGFGTCQWAWSLDAVHDRNVVPVEPALQQATLNLFADLGAAPATAIAGLVTPTAVSSLDVYGLNPLNIRSGKIKVWDGSSWQSHPVKVWDGSSWQSHPARGYSGDDFIVGK
ncbi:MAG: N,N-dimethylformamidase beta subunit family domain-containing protein, partial [Candidatus Saccharimonadales bacterium]